MVKAEDEDVSGQERPFKRQKLSIEREHDAVNETTPHGPSGKTTSTLAPISPPPLLRKKDTAKPLEINQPQSTMISVSSPIQLTEIRDLPATDNVDTTSLREILGDPLLKEVWNFNYLHDIDFIMSHLDDDVRSLVRANVIHGSWRKEDTHRIRLEEDAERWPNVKLITAHMPQMFGTHHSKMLVLIRHDDCAQVIIHTANMIAQDWTNLCQAVWKSPLLPLSGPEDQSLLPHTDSHALGSGLRFKTDLLRYLEAYEGRLRNLREQLCQYDFSSVRAALIASTPNAKQPLPSPTSTAWGWPGLQQILQSIPPSPSADPCIHVQISSIGTLPEKWMNAFFEVLATTSSSSPPELVPSTPFNKSVKSTAAATSKPTMKIVFPTEDEVRNSLDGYASGSSIHLKLGSKAQQKQFEIMKPMLHRWTTGSGNGGGGGAAAEVQQEKGVREAGRHHAAPHIKTYIRFADIKCKTIDWAMITSANLSKQAWGELGNKDGRVGIASYEIGVVVWPGLFADSRDQEVVMCPAFRKNGVDIEEDVGGKFNKVVGLRMPYGLPLARYGSGDKPWCAEQAHLTPDSHGVVWPGYEARV